MKLLWDIFFVQLKCNAIKKANIWMDTNFFHLLYWDTVAILIILEIVIVRET